LLSEEPEVSDGRIDIVRHRELLRASDKGGCEMGENLDDIYAKFSPGARWEED
jgi:hypothetical protein